MRLGGAVNNGLVVAKHVALLSYRYTEIMEHQPQIHNLINASVGCNEFTSMCCCLHSGLLLGIPINGHFVKEVENASDRMACKHVMVQVDIDTVREGHVIA